jgi:hypothetical protein
MTRPSVRLSICFFLLCCALPLAAQTAAKAQTQPQALTEQSNEVVCSSGTACKSGFVPLFTATGGSAKVGDSLIKQSGSTVSVTGSETVTGGISSGGTVSGAALSGNGASVTNVNAAFLNGLSSGAFALVGSSNTFNGNQGINGTLGVSGGERFNNTIQFTDDGTSNVQPSLMINAVDCCTFGNRMIWAHSPAFPFWGVYYDDNADVMHWQQNLGANLMSLDFFNGNLDVFGAITAGVKDFKIDHPLDPTNKFLYHSSVESSEMMNIYTGNATLDNGGEAAVSLPKWFESLNTDFRYQLTAVGAAAPNLHVGQEIAHHQFRIAGGAPGIKVSWQVTAVRHDAYAKAHPLAVEVRKSDKERGHYLYPDAFGVPKLTQEEMVRQR